MKYISKQTAGMEVGVVSGLWDCVGFVKESLEGHEIKIDPIYSQLYVTGLIVNASSVHFYICF